MILPVAGSAQTEAMLFFEAISIKHLDEYHPRKSWRKALMFFSQTVPSVRHAAIALALIYRNYLDRGSNGDLVRQPQSPKDWLPDKAALFHYNRAIQLLLDQAAGDNTEVTAITLLVCYLFACFDHLACNYVQAVKHLRGGVELSHNIDKAILNNTSAHDDFQPSGVRTLISQIATQIRRLDMQATTFLVDWIPTNANEETLMSQFPPSDSAFRSLDEASDHLYPLVARVMRLRHTQQEISMTATMSPLTSSLKDTVLEQLEAWSNRFENMLQKGRSHETDSETPPLVSLLRLQYTTTWILLSSYGPGREMEYDKFLPQFQQCVALAGGVAAAHERYSGSLQPTFTPEIGLVPVLYIIGVKCRHPLVRREALSILRRQPIREAVWDSISAAKVVERVIEIEEGGSEKEKATPGMEQIAVWQRVEVMSWLHVVSGPSAPRLDITYTLCAQEGAHIESLML